MDRVFHRLQCEVGEPDFRDVDFSGAADCVLCAELGDGASNISFGDNVQDIDGSHG